MIFLIQSVTTVCTLNFLVTSYVRLGSTLFSTSVVVRVYHKQCSEIRIAISVEILALAVKTCSPAHVP